ncbi:MAG: 50S ribosomal protein L19 [Candidatus Pacebacteria bacterium]|nr:50S ribosomal protein L19 [Candidatus Paceibacterota bacterium]
MNSSQTQQFVKPYLKSDLPQIKIGDTIKVHQKIKEGDKERIQVFEGVVIAKKHGAGVSGSMTVRKIIDGVGVEKILPLHSPSIAKIEVVAHGKVRRAKLYYLRDRVGKKAKIKRKEIKSQKQGLQSTESPEKAKVSG